MLKLCFGNDFTDKSGNKHLKKGQNLSKVTSFKISYKY